MSLPIEAIVEAVAMSENPALRELSQEQLFELENCLSKPTELRKMPRHKPAVVLPSDTRFSLTLIKRDKHGNPVLNKEPVYTQEPDVDKKGVQKTGADGEPLFKKVLVMDEHGDPEYYDVPVLEKRVFFVRKLEWGDQMEISAIGPQIIETFFDADPDAVSRMSTYEVALEVIQKSIANRLQLAMTDLSEAILQKLCDLMIDTKTGQSLLIEDFTSVDPIEGNEAIARTLQVNALFFYYLTQRIPDDLRSTLSSLAGMISPIGLEIGTLIRSR